VHGGLKFRVKQSSRGVLPGRERDGLRVPPGVATALVPSQPHKFHLPSAFGMRFNWSHADLAALDPDRALELSVDAWRMITSLKKLSRAYDQTQPQRPRYWTHAHMHTLFNNYTPSEPSVAAAQFADAPS